METRMETLKTILSYDRPAIIDASGVVWGPIMVDEVQWLDDPRAGITVFVKITDPTAANGGADVVNAAGGTTFTPDCASLADDYEQVYERIINEVGDASTDYVVTLLTEADPTEDLLDEFTAVVEAYTALIDVNLQVHGYLVSYVSTKLRHAECLIELNKQYDLLVDSELYGPEYGARMDTLNAYKKLIEQTDDEHRALVADDLENLVMSAIADTLGELFGGK